MSAPSPQIPWAHSPTEEPSSTTTPLATLPVPGDHPSRYAGSPAPAAAAPPPPAVQPPVWSGRKTAIAAALAIGFAAVGAVGAAAAIGDQSQARSGPGGGQLPGGQVPGGQFQGGPGGHHGGSFGPGGPQGGQLPQGQPQVGQLPQGQLPQGQGSQLPQGQLPQRQTGSTATGRTT